MYEHSIKASSALEVKIFEGKQFSLQRDSTRTISRSASSSRFKRIPSQTIVYQSSAITTAGDLSAEFTFYPQELLLPTHFDKYAKLAEKIAFQVKWCIQYAR